MIFKGLRKFAGNEFPQVTRYLATTLANFAADLATGLERLTIRDNFNCYVVDVAVPSSGVVQLVNRYQTKAVDVLFLSPTQPFVVDSVNETNIGIATYGGAAGTASVAVIKR